MSNTIQKLYEQGQSVWCDNLSRRMIDSGELQRLVNIGIVGVTSNPTILMKAIAGGSDYDEPLHRLLDAGVKDIETLYEKLVLPDIADAADILRPAFDRTGGVDGYVSLEVDPKLAYDTESTIAEARRLFAELSRPNILIKVPATDEGIPAIETLIGEGVNINVTLIFSAAMYRRVMRAYLEGLKRLDASGGRLAGVASVASFFVSRVDTLVDKLLEVQRANRADAAELPGMAAIANAKLAYARFQEAFDEGGEFGPLASRGARVQRPLWASTSTKNPAYPDTKYVDGLVGPHTVNTIPPETLEAVLDHGASGLALTEDLAGARVVLARLAEFGIDMKAVTDRLLKDGVEAFAKSFEDLLANLSAKREQLRPVRQLSASANQGC